MDKTTFWELIKNAKQSSGGNPDKQAEILVAALAELSEPEILAYQTILDEFKDKAYIAELWEIAYILDGGCGDDGFMDFRAWLIGQGKDIFEKALENPESLVDVVEVGQDTKSEALLYVAIEAYEINTGKDADTMPRRVKPLPELQGKFSSDEASKLKRFPKATAKFWNYWQDYYESMIKG